MENKKEREFIRTELGIFGDWIGDGDASIDMLADVLAKWHRQQSSQPPKPEPQPITLPTDMDDVLTEAERLGWVFDKAKWHCSGYTSRTTEQLYIYLKRTSGLRSEIEKRMKGGSG